MADLTIVGTDRCMHARDSVVGAFWSTPKNDNLFGVPNEVIISAINMICLILTDFMHEEICWMM